MRIADGFVRRTVGESYMVMPVGTRTREIPGVIALSESGALLWELLESDCDEEGLVDALLAEYDVEPDKARADVKAFLADLSEKGILEE